MKCECPASPGNGRLSTLHAANALLLILLSSSLLGLGCSSCGATPCVRSTECPSGHVCRHGSCVPGCRSDSDCLASRVCASSGYCVDQWSEPQHERDPRADETHDSGPPDSHRTADWIAEERSLEPTQDGKPTERRPLEQGPSPDSDAICIPNSPVSVLRGHEQRVGVLALSPSGTMLVSGALGHSELKVWSVTTGKILDTLRPPGFIDSVSFSGDGKHFIYKAAMRAWRVEASDLRLTKHWDLPKSYIAPLAYSPDGRTIASGGQGGRVLLLDTSTGKLRTTVPGHIWPIGALAFSPNGKYLASGSSDSTLVLWSAASASLIGVFGQHGDRVNTVAYLPDGKRVAAGSEDGDIMIWSTAKRRVEFLLDGHQEAVHSIAVTQDGRLLASASEDKTVKIWNLRSGKLEATLRRHGKQVYSVSFSANGKLLASGSWDRTIRLWRCR